ncbi:MAG TPA: CoA-binding protein [Phycisphaerae bacterium]|jgi:predicted CoA-binding protein|nr:CoA-binding protein [Phycisphaerae bacterium]HOB73471.1 CoA-binding protein [Phycisphaerae bacterium]HOJ54079.1 CoA-binding protein [Phycisphaerae bacterium]HOL25628.1 CoA-binding protein [Phycisphaerae bacterium]HPU31838.1 CoA-binding protein [Phycisphaerae bacterium]
MPQAFETHADSPTHEQIRELLTRARTIAVVGLSDNPSRDSHRVSAYLQNQGYRIIPVNPGVTEVLGEKAYPSLREVPEKVDIVNIFRRPEAVPAIVEDAIATGAGAVWMQLGITHDEAARRASSAGIPVIMDRCIMVEHRGLGA